jgi:hypothetical protein
VDELPDNDDGVGEADEGLDDAGFLLRADLEFTEAAVVP